MSNALEAIHAAALQAAASAGEAAGTNAAINFVTRDNAAALLAGIDAGDPAVMEGLPYLDLSGQWSDGMTDCDVLRDIEAWAYRVDKAAGDYVYGVGVTYGSAAGSSDVFETATDLVETYRDGFDRAVSDKIEADALETVGAIEADATDDDEPRAETFTLTIATTGAAFADGNLTDELARMLRTIADALEGYGESAGSVRDVNGNTVGTYNLF